jgi:hypothetical protein
VDETSAAPIQDNTDRCGIDSDHRGMCKFDSPSSQAFRTTVAALRRYAKEAPAVTCNRWTRSLDMMRQNRQHEAVDLLKSILPLESQAHVSDSLKGGGMTGAIEAPSEGS